MLSQATLKALEEASRANDANRDDAISVDFNKLTMDTVKKNAAIQGVNAKDIEEDPYLKSLLASNEDVSSYLQVSRKARSNIEQYEATVYDILYNPGSSAHVKKSQKGNKYNAGDPRNEVTYRRGYTPSSLSDEHDYPVAGGVLSLRDTQFMIDEYDRVSKIPSSAAAPRPRAGAKKKGNAAMSDDTTDESSSEDDDDSSEDDEDEDDAESSEEKDRHNKEVVLSTLALVQSLEEAIQTRVIPPKLKTLLNFVSSDNMTRAAKRILSSDRIGKFTQLHRKMRGLLKVYVSLGAKNGVPIHSAEHRHPASLPELRPRPAMPAKW